MNQFGELYSNYYDLLYSDKNYPLEVDYIANLLQKNKKINSILDLGCGTGKHAELLCRKGYKVCGVDASKEMLTQAEKRRSGIESQLEFVHSTIQELELNTKFDAVTSLFHVMSYQASNKELIKAFKIARKHLKKDGLFIFDFWYGPAVLTDLPSVRVKRLEDKNIKVTRIAEPELNAQKNLVKVNYNIFIEDKKTAEIIEKKELHTMRYFFDTELELICKKTGFNILNKFQWLNKNEPNFDSWNVVWVVKN